MLSNMRVHAKSWYRRKMTIINGDSSYLNIKFSIKKRNNLLSCIKWISQTKHTYICVYL